MRRVVLCRRLGQQHDSRRVFHPQRRPGIVIQPQNQTANQGQNAVFSVTATGSSPLSYQWQFNSSTLSGATSSTYTVANAQLTNVGSYSVIVTNSLGTTTSSNALLTLIVPPAITNLPQSLTVTQGLSATFTVGASGSVPFTYQWTYNNGNISGATASSYTVSSAQPANAGSYAVVVSNPAGSATSSPPAILTVNAVPTPPGIATQPQNQTVSQTSNATFTVTATGTTPLYYQWRFNGAGLQALPPPAIPAPTPSPPMPAPTRSSSPTPMARSPFHGDAHGHPAAHHQRPAQQPARRRQQQRHLHGRPLPGHQPRLPMAAERHRHLRRDPLQPDADFDLLEQRRNVFGRGLQPCRQPNQRRGHADYRAGGLHVL